MSTKLPVKNSKELIKILEKKGFTFHGKVEVMRYIQTKMALK